MKTNAYSIRVLMYQTGLYSVLLIVGRQYHTAWLLITSGEKKMRDKAYELAKTPGTYYVDQFGSPDVRTGYKPLGGEVAKEIDGDIDVFRQIGRASCRERV